MHHVRPLVPLDGEDQPFVATPFRSCRLEDLAECPFTDERPAPVRVVEITFASHQKPGRNDKNADGQIENQSKAGDSHYPQVPVWSHLRMACEMLVDFSPMADEKMDWKNYEYFLGSDLRYESVEDSRARIVATKLSTKITPNVM